MEQENYTPPSRATLAILGLLAVAGSVNVIDYQGTRFYGVEPDTLKPVIEIIDTLIIVLRCAMVLTVMLEDITSISLQAADSQKWKRQATDARLKAIQQFTRYIFHEARVPLQAVTLAVDELGASLDNIRGHTASIRDLATAVQAMA